MIPGSNTSTDRLLRGRSRWSFEPDLCYRELSLPHMAFGSHLSLTQPSTVIRRHLLYNTAKGAIDQTVRSISKDLMRSTHLRKCYRFRPHPPAPSSFSKGRRTSEMLKMKCWLQRRQIVSAPPRRSIGHIVTFSSGRGKVAG